MSERVRQIEQLLAACTKSELEQVRFAFRAAAREVRKELDAELARLFAEGERVQCKMRGGFWEVVTIRRLRSNGRVQVELPSGRKGTTSPQYLRKL